MATVMHRDFRTGRTGSLFAHEGRFIAMLRPGLCLIGWPWAVADRAARDLVYQALAKVGARRPTTEDAQYTWGARDVKVHRERCATCGGQVPKHRITFCSKACMLASKAPATWIKTAHVRQTAESSCLPEIPPEDTCDGCGAVLTSVANNRKYCSIDCRTRHIARLRKNPVRNVSCGNCGTAFQTTDPRKTSCSPACTNAACKKRA